MVGRRRVLVAVLAASAVVLATGQASSGIETPTPLSSLAAAGAAAAASTVTSAAVLGPSIPSVGQTIRTSVGSADAQLAGGGTQPVMSADGDWQVFVSTANLDGTSGTIKHVYVRDVRPGGTTRLVSVSPNAADGDSYLPTISADGRYVSFITKASNIVPTAAATSLTLVVCDRDPGAATDPSTGQPLFDQATACERVYSTDAASPVRIMDDSEHRPSIADNGQRVIMVQRPAQPTPNVLKWFQVADNNGLVSVPVYDPGHAVLPANNGTVFDFLEPTLSSSGTTVDFVASMLADPPTERILKIQNLGGVEATVRMDRNEANNGYLGDVVNGTVVTEFGSLSVSEFGNIIEFHRFSVDTNPGPGFRQGAPVVALAPPPPPEDRIYVVTSFGSTIASSQIVSYDNGGTLDADMVPSFSGAISGDGRYVAFVTESANSHDGQDVNLARELVVRDLTTDANRVTQNLTRLKGALVTAKATNPCTPTAPKINCAAADASITDISFDENGTRVSWASPGTDLVTGDTNTSTDAFVRSWQPTISAVASGPTDFGNVQAGDSKVQDVQVLVSGFGPLVIQGVGVAPGSKYEVVGDNCTNRFSALVDGSTCSVSIRYAPDVVTGSPDYGTLTATSDQYPATLDVQPLTGLAVLTGPKSAAGENIRASLTPTGGQSDSGGDSSMVSGNGRWDVFVSDTDLTGRASDPAADPVDNVYVRDLANPQNTVQISLHSTLGADTGKPSRPRAATGHPAGINPDGSSYSPSISSDGRFVSFFTHATDIVPVPSLDQPSDNVYVLVVCDRDPTNTKDSAGNPVLDRLRPGTQLPDYVCYPLQSGAFATDATGADDSSRPMLSGDGTHITWVEDIDLSGRRVRVATLSKPGGPLAKPTGLGYVQSFTPGFAAGSTRTQEDAEQFYPTMSEDGSKVLFVAGQGCQFFGGPCTYAAIIETDIAAGTSFRFDTVDNDDFLGDFGGTFDPPAMDDTGGEVAYAFRPNTEGGTAASTVYVSTRDGAFVNTVVVSQKNDESAGSGGQPALSGDGRYVAFMTQAGNMHNGVDPKGGSCFLDGASAKVYCQIVARDLVRDKQRQDAKQPRLPSEIVSTSIGSGCPAAPPAGRVCAADNISSNPSMDETGSEIGFDTAADDVVLGDSNTVPESEGSGFVPATDAFVHTWRPQLTVPAMDFGSVKLGASKTKTFTITFKDLGGTPANFGPISFGKSSILGAAAADYKILATTCDGTTLHEGAPAGQPLSAAAESCTFKIRFQPTLPGIRNANLQTPYGTGGYVRPGPAILNALTGFGATPIVTVNPTTVNFGTRLPDDPLTKTVTVTNTGSAPLLITGVVVHDTTHPGAKGDYTVDFTGCALKVVVGGSCAITVTFTGSRVGVRDAVLVIISNASAGPTSVGLLARVDKPTVVSNPAVSPVRRVITITGKGFAPKHLVEVGFDNNPQVTVKTKANGTFVLQMVVLPNGPQGPRTLFGHSVGLNKSIRGEFPFLVVLSGTDPGNVIIRD